MTPHEQGYCEFFAMIDVCPLPFGFNYLDWWAGYCEAMDNSYDMDQVVL